MTYNESFELSSDVTRRLQIQNRMLRALSDSRKALMRARNETDLLQDICRIIVDDCGYAMVWVGFAENDDRKAVRPVAFSGFDEGYLESLQITWGESERGLGPTGSAIRTGRVQMCRNMLTDPQFLPWRKEALERGYASSIAIPLSNEQQSFGALTAYSQEPDPFTDDEVRLLDELAADLSQGILAIRLRAAHSEAEEALQQSEERYRQLFEDDLTGDFIATSDGKILLCNRAFVRLFGFPDREEALSSSMTRLHPYEGSWSKFVELVRQHRVLEQFECERRRFDGSSVHIVENVIGTFDEKGELVQLKGYVFDDTERKQAMLELRRANVQLQQQAEELMAMNEELHVQTDELSEVNAELQAQTDELSSANEELRLSEARLREARTEAELEKRRLEAVMETLPVGMALLDTRGGVIRSNAAFEGVWGGPLPPTRSLQDYSAYQAWSEETGEPLPPEDWASSKALRTGCVIAGQLLKIRRFDSSDGWVINSAAPILDPEGRLSGTAVAIQDITHLHRVQDELKELNDELERRVSERTETLERIIEQLEDEVGRRVAVERQLQERSRLLEGFFRHTIAPLAFMDREFNLIRFNAPFARIFGAEPDDSSAVNYFSIDPDIENKAIFEQVVATKQAYHAYARAFFGLRGTSEITYWNVRLTPVLDDQQEVQFLVFNLEDVTERQLAFGELQERTRQLQRLTLELSHAEDRERRRLARLLHDDLQQLLVGARLHADAAVKKIHRDTEGTLAAIDRARGLIVQAVEKSRSLSHELSPPFINQGSLADALGWLARHMSVTCGLTVELEADAEANFRSEALRSFAYKATQEMLFNVIKHARVQRAKVRLRRRNGVVQLTVADEGMGFDVRRVKQTDGIGILSIQERAAILGGRMKFRSTPGRGCVFLLSIPADSDRPAGPE